MVALIFLACSATYALWALVLRSYMEWARHQAGYRTRYTLYGPVRMWCPQQAEARKQFAGWPVLVILVTTLAVILIKTFF